MAMPAALFALLIPAGPWQLGWGVPMASDTAFAVALIVMLGRRVPVELRVFLTAAAIVVVGLFYSGTVHWEYLAGAAGAMLILILLNRSRVYRAMPNALLGASVLSAQAGVGLLWYARGAEPAESIAAGDRTSAL
jgi:NhaA family Na+:H+ antiporter